MKLWTLNMIFGQQRPLPQIQQVKISKCGLLYVMDTIGRITIINRDLANDEHGVIFILKKTIGTRGFDILRGEQTQDQFQKQKDQLDLVQAFKRTKLLEPFDKIVTFSDCELRLYDLTSDLNKKEGICAFTSNLVMSFSQPSAPQSFKIRIQQIKLIGQHVFLQIEKMNLLVMVKI